MSDSGSTEPERKTQGAFRFAAVGALAILLLAIAGFDRFLAFVPNRKEFGPATATLRFTRVALDARRFEPFRLVGAWEVDSDDDRVGGISALAVEDGDLLALSDSGALIRFGQPSGAMGMARIREVPDGPGDGRFKRNRDSEALARDPKGRGWWMAFENRHQLWLYDRGFDRALGHIALGRHRWRANKGVEGIATAGDGLLLFPEEGQSVLRVLGKQARKIRLGNPGGRISDVATVAPGQMIAVERRLSPFGFTNSLVWVEPDGAGYRFGRRVALPLRPIDNVEAIAIEPRPDGGRRLWLITDDNFQRPLRTLLISLDFAGRD